MEDHQEKKPHKKIYVDGIRNVYEELGIHKPEVKNEMDLVHPCVISVVGKSQSGKTNLVPSLIERLGYFHRVVLFSGSSPAKEPIYKFLKTQYKDMFEEYYKFGDFVKVCNELENDKDIQDERILMIIDDFIAERKAVLDTLGSFSIQSRKTTKGGLTLMYLSQNYYMIPITARKQNWYVILMSGFDRKEINSVCSRFSSNDLSVDDIYSMYKKATASKGLTDFFLIDMATKHDNLKFRKQFDKCFHINEEEGFGESLQEINEKHDREDGIDYLTDPDYDRKLKEIIKKQNKK